MKTLKEKAMAVLSMAYHGEHNIPGKVKEKCGGFYFEVNVPVGISTFDLDALTRLVIGAHDECVRLEIDSSGPGRIKLLFHDRQRDGRCTQRHPTIEQAITGIRGEAPWES